MKLVVDMNLSPEWVPLFRQNGFDAIHWCAIGKANAADEEVLQWARENQAVVFTHDLDFGILLAQTESSGPRSSRFGLRTSHLGTWVILFYRSFQHTEQLYAGALITVDESRARVRILPIRRRSNTLS